MTTASASRWPSQAGAGSRTGISRLALCVGLAGLLGAATPAEAQFGFPWYSARPEPRVLVYPTRPHIRATIARRYSHPRGDRRVAAKQDAAHSIVGPLIIVVSVNRQRLTVYDGDRPIATSPVSTGKEGHETPYGVFSVIQKERLHRSNLYNDAPMPFMQRITWSGVALHAGPLPGRAASHGCIRLPPAFAGRLWDMTKVGVRVIVAHNDLAPVDFAHPRLFTLRQDAPAMPPTAAAPLDGGNSAASPSAPGRGAALEPASGGVSPNRALRQVASLADIAIPESEPLPPTQRAVPDLGPTEGVSKANDETSEIALMDAPPSAYAEMAPTPEEIAQAVAMDAARAAATASMDLLVPKSAAAEPADEHGSAIAAAPTSTAPPAASDPITAEPAALPAAPEPKAASLGEQPAIDAPAAKPQPAPKKMSPISIFVSRKEKKLFVRRGFEPVFDAPVTFEGDQPLGTHVYTATNTPADGATLHWVALSIAGTDDPSPMRPAPEAHGRRAYPPPPQVFASGAGAALERVQLSDEVRERIEGMITPGSSLIVSDKGLGIETGRGTDFVILTH
ncbi:MAG: L,D-transpeptidase family protein [Beijerinckiaceae bacterium]